MFRINRVCLTTLPLTMALVFLANLAGCHKKQSAKGESAAEINKVVDQWDDLYQPYLHGSLDEARKSQEESIKLIENCSLAPRLKAHMFYFTYSRLYVLENAAGNQVAADADFSKAKYWSRREDELIGDAPQNVAAHEKMFTPEHCSHVVDVFARHNNHGNDPDFMTNRAATTLPAGE